MLDIRDLSIRTKLVSLTLVLVLVPLLAVSYLSLNRFDTALRRAAEEDLEHLVRNIYAMCSMQEETVQGELARRMALARTLIIGEASRIRADEQRSTSLGLLDQATGAAKGLDVPGWELNGELVNLDPHFIDRVGELTGGICTIFHMLPSGALLRISTNLVDREGHRAVGTLIPGENPVAQAIARGKAFKGRTLVLEEWYIMVYEPVLDERGKILGALSVGVREPAESLRTQVKAIRVGNTGYAYIMDSQGVLKVHPAKEGENIIDAQDTEGFHYIRAMVEAATQAPEGQVETIRYPWMNPELGERSPRQKITKYTYFRPWDWIIAAGTYEEEIYQALHETEKFIVAVVLVSLPLVFVFTVGLSRVLTRRIGELTQATARMLDGDLSQRVEVHGRDEVGVLGLSFNRMASQIQEYTTSLQRMVYERTKELADSRERYRELSTFLNSILESATQYAIMALDFRGQIMEFNKGAERLFGWSKQEVLRKENIGITIPAEERERGIQRQIAARTRAEGLCELEMERVRKDGSRFPAHSVVTAMVDPEGRVSGFVEIVRDLTRRRLLERQLRETKEFLENVMASSVDGIVTTDLKGHITFLNRGMEEMLGYAREELLGTHISRLYVKGIQEARQIMEVLRARQRVENYEMQILRKDQEVLSIINSASLLRDGEGNVIGTVGVFKDLTQQKRLEAKLKETQAHLVEASKLRALGELVAGVAHELNNPLMASQTILHVIEGELHQDCPNKDRLQVIRRCNERIARIVDHLREFSRQARPELRPLDVNVPVDNALLITEQQLLDHQIHLERRLAQGLPPVMADPNQLEQVFLNLISNARDALDEKEGNKELLIQTLLEQRAGHRWVVVTVKDTGPGIPPEILDKVMEPFFTTKPVGRGTGLGLSLCFKIVEDHGGMLEINSQVGLGTEVRVLLPAMMSTG
jgi:two-component system NtrC family sensor kinase